MTINAAAQDRMPSIPDDKLTPQQKESVRLLLATPRANGVSGPFVVMLRSPEMMDRLQSVGEYLRFKNSLPQVLVEMSILVSAREWTQQYEWDTHYPLALKAGLAQSVADQIAEGRRPEKMTDDQALVYDFLTELFHNKSVSDGTYARVNARFAERGVVDLSTIAGYYTTLAMLMNVARTPPLAGSTAPKLSPFPR